MTNIVRNENNNRYKPPGSCTLLPQLHQVDGGEGASVLRNQQGQQDDKSVAGLFHSQTITSTTDKYGHHNQNRYLRD